MRFSTISEWIMDRTTFSQRLSRRLLDFAWDEWAQIGISGLPHRTSPWAQDPEALIVFTLEVARADARLFDELLDWLLLNEGLLSVRRLRALCIDAVDEALVAGSLGWLARRRPRARLRARDQGPALETLEPLFPGMSSIGQTDPDFEEAGLLRQLVEPSRKSQAPDRLLPINLGFRLRGMLGISIRAEVVRILLGTTTPLITAAALAQSSVYSKRNVHDSLADLAASDVVSMFTIGGEQRYAIDKERWSVLLGVSAEDLPIHREWPQLLGALRAILRWSKQPELAELSAYMLGSSARQLLERIRPELAFAGVRTNLRATAEVAPQVLEHVVDDIMAPLEALTFVSH